MSLTPRVDCIIIRKVSMKRCSGEEEEEEVGYSWEIGGGTHHELLGHDVEFFFFFLKNVLTDNYGMLQEPRVEANVDFNLIVLYLYNF